MNERTLCLRLYKQAFPEPDLPFEEAIFEHCFKYCRYIEENGKIVSMLFALPCELKTKTETKSVIYIYAAATLQEYRGRGYMARLIEQLNGEGKALFLRPATEGLISFYKKFGFKAVNGFKKEEAPYIKPCQGFETLIRKFPEEASGEQYTAMYYGTEFEFDTINFIYTME